MAGSGEQVIADLADQAVNLVSRGRYPVTRGTIPGNAARVVQVQPDHEQPVHDVARQLRHHVRRAGGSGRFRLSASDMSITCESSRTPHRR
jgi:hypothetical protein